MRRRFVVLLENAPAELQKQITELIAGQQCGWWHWFAHAWLVADPQGTRDVQWWSDAIRELGVGWAEKQRQTLLGLLSPVPASPPAFYVIEVGENGGNYTGFAGGDSHKWLRENWQQPYSRDPWWNR